MTYIKLTLRYHKPTPPLGIFTVFVAGIIKKKKRKKKRKRRREEKEGKEEERGEEEGEDWTL